MGQRTALVLSGGGARGAYEVGVAAGIVEALGVTAADPPPFGLFTGTSVGAINATFLAAHADRGDLGVEALADVWRGLKLPVHVRLDPLRLFAHGRVGKAVSDRWRRFTGRGPAQTLGGSLLDPEPLDAVVRDAIPWDRLHRNLDTGALRGLVVAALQVASGRTAVFHELAPGLNFRASKDPRRASVAARITAAHVLASAAIPLVFPARRIGDGWYCDGGLRFNTPIAPAIRAGAERLVVVSLLHRPQAPRPVTNDEYPNLLFLMGKVLNALLLDPVAYDLQVLDRFNRLVDVLHETLSPKEWQRVADVLTRSRGLPYRHLATLVFTPSRDLGEVAAEHLRDRGPPSVGWLGESFLRRAGQPGATWEDDLASYLLFDGGYAERLIELGRADVRARADEVRAWFARPEDAAANLTDEVAMVQRP